MHDIPRKDREDADDVDEDEVAEVTGGLSVNDDGGCIPPFGSDYPNEPGASIGALMPIDDPYAED